jgi:hypothetical protein
VCRTDKPEVDFEVSSTHIGLVFNPLVYEVIAHRLAGQWPPGYQEPAKATRSKRTVATAGLRAGIKTRKNG